MFTFSASNSDLYIANRTMHGLVVKGQAPRFLARTDKRGIPYPAMWLAALIACIAFLNVAEDSREVFGYFVNLVSIFGLLIWIFILVAHIYLVKARRAQGVDESSVRYKSPFGLGGSYVALWFCILIALTKNFAIFTYSEDYGAFRLQELHHRRPRGIPLYLLMISGYKFWHKTKQIRPEEADLCAGKDVIDRDEQECLAREAEEKASGKRGDTIHRHTIGYLF